MSPQDQKIARDYAAMLEALRDVVTRAGDDTLARAIAVSPATPTRVPAPSITLAAPVTPLQLVGIGFQLLNLVEENAAVQLRRDQEKAAKLPAGSFDAILRDARAQGATRDDLARAARETEVELVLTAHPTEARRRTMIAHYRELYLLAVSLENPVFTGRERARLRGRVTACLERIWRTGEVHLDKPTVAAERAYVMHHLLNVFPEALDVVGDRFERAAADAGLAGLPAPRLRFGSWVGGDRDGHPFVTPEVTRQTLEEMRLAAVVLLRRQLQPLVEHLSPAPPFSPVPARLLAAIESCAKALGPESEDVLARNAGEPFRQLVGLVLARLPAQVERGHVTRLDEREGSYRDASALCEDLLTLAASLEEIGAAELAREVRRTVRLVETFGLHLATLDLRQGSTVHERALDQMLAWAGVEEPAFSSLEEDARRAFLTRELGLRRPLVLRDVSAGEDADRVLGVYAVLAEHVARRGAAGLGPSIVSMTRDVSDLLAVYLFQREVGLLVREGDVVRATLPVVPLFETIDDLERAPAVLDTFLAHPVTRATLATHGSIAQVMLGYSDSNKDGGIVAAQVAVERAERALAEVTARHGVRLQVFHGRGGSAARGGGPNRHFLSARPSSFSGAIRATVQGETVARELSNLLTAAGTLETWLAGSLAARAHARTSSPRPPALDEALTRLAARSREAYEALLHHPSLLPYFRAATPVDVLEHSGIGSRPARRTGTRTLSDLRAIPWVFSWNQCRHCLPSFFGVGAGLEALAREDRTLWEALARGAREDAFVSNLLHNVEMGIASAHARIASDYASLVEDAEVRGAISGLVEAERARTEQTLEALFGGPLAARRPALVSSIAARADALERVHAVQVELLRSWRASSDPETLGHLLMTVNVIAAGLRSTG